MKKIFPWALFVFGLILILSSFLPSLFFWYWSWIVRPVTLFDPAQVSPYAIPKLLTSQGLYQDLPMTDPTSWFPQAHLASASASPVNSFLLSLPTQKVFDLPIQVNGTNLETSPIHYPGSALPGRVGNTVILGHSALPYLYLFKSPLAIFNPLLKTKIGDEVVVDFNGFKYTYKISQINEVSPNQIEVLSQPANRRQLTLITCVPLGTYLRRLVVIGDLIN